MHSHQLSKSKFMAGLQCPKRLWLQVHRPELSPDIGDSLPMLNGNEIGEMARRLYPGVLVEYEAGMGAAIEKTRQLVADPDVRMIHEATFVHDDVLVRVDLLERTDKAWILTEVKGATSVKDYYIPDVAVQAWVLAGCGLKLDALRLMYVNNRFVYQGDGNYEGLLIAEDIGEQVEALLDDIPAQKKTFVAILDGGEPEIGMGLQCGTPYECEFCAYCTPEDTPEYPVTSLPNLREPRKSALMAAYEDIRDIPESELSNDNHRRIWRATCAGREDVDVAEAEALKALPWPRYYLDFETIALAVPRWKGMRPYMKAPFQWSCHIHHADGRMEHKEFLDLSGHDPRRPCAESLVKYLGRDGVVLAYNAGFERSVIRELVEACPDLRDGLMNIHDRIEDLLPITKKAYYHPAQKGSWSLKAVLPVLAPDLSYGELEGVHHGEEAQLAWLQAAGSDEEEREKLAGQLREYCKLDTLAMVRIVEALLKKAEHG
ncbi:MAG: DUF2779 domain-containing protein [Mariprofundaceae bacterium]|nr:DUF2779 domain-containing protein [Mariprofundaceae bacterium]